MKTTLEFNLPEERAELEMAQKGPRYFNALWEFKNWLRSEIKYKEREELEEIRTKFCEVLEDEDIML